jgi:hypothetical protein
MSDLGIETLCKGLRVCSSNVARLHGTMSLRVLRLNRNRIGDTGAVALSYLISHGGGDNNRGSGGDNNDGGVSNGMPSSRLCFSLEELSLADNPIGALGVAALLQASSPTFAVNHSHLPNHSHSNGQYHVSQSHSSSSSSSSSKLSYTGASALRRLSLARTNLSLVSLHDIGSYYLHHHPYHLIHIPPQKAPLFTTTPVPRLLSFLTLFVFSLILCSSSCPSLLFS